MCIPRGTADDEPGEMGDGRSCHGVRRKTV